MQLISLINARAVFASVARFCRAVLALPVLIQSHVTAGLLFGEKWFNKRTADLRRYPGASAEIKSQINARAVFAEPAHFFSKCN